MPFQALTDAPTLRSGVRLNFMAVPQRAGEPPARLSAGVRVTVRFGHCCPLVREGEICAADDESAVLVLDGIDWALGHQPSGSSIPGIVSEDWIVLHRAA